MVVSLKSCERCAFSVHAPHPWNNLPQDIKVKTNMTSLKKSLSVRTHVCGLRHLTADLRQQIFQTFSFMFCCSQSNLRHQTSNLRQCLQNIEKVRKKFAITNRPSGVVSRIHVYVDLHNCYIELTTKRLFKFAKTQ